MSIGRVIKDGAEAVMHAAAHSKRMRGVADGLHMQFGDFKARVHALDEFTDKPHMPGGSGKSPSHTPYKPDLARKPKSMSDAEYFHLLDSSVHNPNGTEAVLGKYYVPGTSSYVEVAEGRIPPATYFSLGDQWDDISAKHDLTDKDMFEAFNVPFLDRMMSEGKSISFSHNPLDFPDSALGDELQFLRDNGYVFDPSTMRAYLP